MTWFAPSPASPHATAAVDAGTVASAPAPVAPAPVTAAPPTPSPGATPPPEGPAVRTLDVDRKLVHYKFSTEGAGLLSAELQGEKKREQRPLTMAEGWAQLFGKNVPIPPQMNLAQPV